MLWLLWLWFLLVYKAIQIQKRKQSKTKEENKIREEKKRKENLCSLDLVLLGDGGLNKLFCFF